MKRIVFQGDSITDAERSRDDLRMLGSGYPTIVSATLGELYPGEFECYNMGVSGNRISDLLARWKKDCLNYQPDYLSILVGINDVWHELSYGNGVDAELFEKLYDIVLDETFKALPNIKILLLEPFVLQYTATSENWTYFRTETDKRIAAVRRLGQKYNLPTVDLQKLFDEALQKAPVDFWSRDGVHPTAPGYAVITKAWLEGFGFNQ